MVVPVVERGKVDFVCFAFSQAFGAVSEGIPEAKWGNPDWMMTCMGSHGNWEHVMGWV